MSKEINQHFNDADALGREVEGLKKKISTEKQTVADSISKLQKDSDLIVAAHEKSIEEKEVQKQGLINTAQDLMQ